MRRVLWFLVGVLSLFAVSAQCVSELPSVIDDSLLVCADVIEVPDLIAVSGEGDITLDCGGAELLGDGNAGLVVDTPGYVIIRNCHFKGFSTALYVNNTQSLTVLESSFLDGDRGIYVNEGSQQTIITQSLFSSLKQEAIGIHSPRETSISRSTFSNNGYGMYFYETSRNGLVFGNNITNNDYGAFAEGAYHYFYGNVFNNDYTSFQALHAKNIEFANNTVVYAKQNGAAFLYSFEVTVKSNNISHNDGTGMVLYGVWDSKIDQNIMDYNSLAGLYLTASSSDNVVSGNDFQRNGDYGIYVNDSVRNRLIGNLFDFTSLVVGIGSEENYFCPGNIYQNGAQGPRCETSTLGYSLVNEEEESGGSENNVSEEAIAVPILQSSNETVSNESVLSIEVEEEEPRREVIIKEENYKPRKISTGLDTNKIRNILTQVLLADLVSESRLNEEINSMSRKISKTMKKINLAKSIQTSIVGGQVHSSIFSKIVFDEPMKDVYVYEYIPKTCAEHVDLIEVDPYILQRPGVHFEVINADPLIVWKFDQVEEGEEIVLGYTIKNEVQDLPSTLILEGEGGTLTINEAMMCTNEAQPVTVPLAEKIGNNLLLFILPVVLIISLPLVIIIFSRFAPKKHR